MTAKDRSMATAPYPTRVRAGKVIYQTGPRVTRITHVAVAVLSDGVEVMCEHSHGHASDKALRACAQRLVNRLNDAAGIPKDAR
jgi:hypothetical protein